MPSTFTIPLTTLQVGSRALGPANARNNEQLIVLTIDRTVAGGLNSLDASSALQVTVDQSNDSGGTWQMIAGTTWPGGVMLIHGSPFTSAELMTGLLPGTGGQLRASATVAGAPIAVAGTLTTT